MKFRLLTAPRASLGQAWPKRLVGIPIVSSIPAAASDDLRIEKRIEDIVKRLERFGNLNENNIYTRALVNLHRYIRPDKITNKTVFTKSFASFLNEARVFSGQDDADSRKAESLVKSGILSQAAMDLGIVDLAIDHGVAEEVISYYHLLLLAKYTMLEDLLNYPPIAWIDRQAWHDPDRSPLVETLTIHPVIVPSFFSLLEGKLNSATGILIQLRLVFDVRGQCMYDRDGVQARNDWKSIPIGPLRDNEDIVKPVTFVYELVRLHVKDPEAADVDNHERGPSAVMKRSIVYNNEAWFAQHMAIIETPLSLIGVVATNVEIQREIGYNPESSLEQKALTIVNTFYDQQHLLPGANILVFSTQASSSYTLEIQERIFDGIPMSSTKASRKNKTPSKEEIPYDRSYLYNMTLSALMDHILLQHGTHRDIKRLFETYSIDDCLDDLIHVMETMQRRVDWRLFPRHAGESIMQRLVARERERQLTPLISDEARRHRLTWGDDDTALLRYQQLCGQLFPIYQNIFHCPFIIIKEHEQQHFNESEAYFNKLEGNADVAASASIEGDAAKSESGNEEEEEEEEEEEGAWSTVSETRQQHETPRNIIPEMPRGMNPSHVFGSYVNRLKNESLVKLMRDYQRGKLNHLQEPAQKPFDSELDSSSDAKDVESDFQPTLRTLSALRATKKIVYFHAFAAALIATKQNFGNLPGRYRTLENCLLGHGAWNGNSLLPRIEPVGDVPVYETTRLPHWTETQLEWRHTLFVMSMALYFGLTPTSTLDEYQAPHLPVLIQSLLSEAHFYRPRLDVWFLHYFDPAMLAVADEEEVSTLQEREADLFTNRDSAERLMHELDDPYLVITPLATNQTSLMRYDHETGALIEQVKFALGLFITDTMVPLLAPSVAGDVNVTEARLATFIPPPILTERSTTSDDHFVQSFVAAVYWTCLTASVGALRLYGPVAITAMVLGTWNDFKDKANAAERIPDHVRYLFMDDCQGLTNRRRREGALTLPPEDQQSETIGLLLQYPLQYFGFDNKHPLYRFMCSTTAKDIFLKHGEFVPGTIPTKKTTPSLDRMRALDAPQFIAEIFRLGQGQVKTPRGRS